MSISGAVPPPHVHAPDPATPPPAVQPAPTQADKDRAHDGGGSKGSAGLLDIKV